MNCSTEPAEIEIKKGLRTSDVAERLGVSVRTVEDWRRRGCGPAFHRISPRLVVYTEADLDEWFKSKRSA